MNFAKLSSNLTFGYGYKFTRLASFFNQLGWQLCFYLLIYKAGNSDKKCFNKRDAPLNVRNKSFRFFSLTCFWWGMVCRKANRKSHHLPCTTWQKIYLLDVSSVNHLILGSGRNTSNTELNLDEKENERNKLIIGKYCTLLVLTADIHARTFTTLLGKSARTMQSD